MLIRRRTTSDWSVLDADRPDMRVPVDPRLEPTAGYNPTRPRSVAIMSARNEWPTVINPA
jgi:hypothetical protein